MSVAALGCLIGIGGPGAVAQSTSRPAASTDPVGIDFRVLSSEGVPVAGVTADQVTLRVDGKRRAVQSLRYVEVRGGPSSASVGVTLDAPYATNVAADLAVPARALVVVVEDESLAAGRERPMRDAVAMLLQALAPDDRVAIVTVPYGGLKLDFTTDRLKTRQVFERIVGQAPRGETTTDSACRTLTTLHALTGLLEDLAGGEAPTTVLFFSMGLVGPSQMVLPPAGAAGQAQPVIGKCTVLPELFTQVGAAAETARANFYIVPPDAGSFSGSLLEGIENLAGVTSGSRLALGTGAETALIRVTRETSGYYVASFVPEAGERNGLNHRIDLRVALPRVTVLARQGAAIPKPRDIVGAAPGVTATALLRQARVHRELPLRLAAYASRNAGDSRLRIVALAEPMASGVTLASAAVGLIDASGQLVAQWSAMGADLVSQPLQAGLVAPRGAYRVRAVAVDTSGRRGTVDYEIDASLAPAGPLQLSSLVVGLSREGRFLPRLQFQGEVSAMAQLEIYGGVAGTPVGAMLEVSDSSNGKAFLAVPLVLEATAEPDRFTARGIIPIGALPPGDFVARAIVEMQGQPAGRVLRTLRKAIR